MLLKRTTPHVDRHVDRHVTGMSTYTVCGHCMIFPPLLTELRLFLRGFQTVTPSVEASGSIQAGSSASSAPEMMHSSYLGHTAPPAGHLSASQCMSVCMFTTVSRQVWMFT